MENKIREDISEIIRKFLGHDEWGFYNDFVNDLGFDSLDMIEFYMDVEKKLNVTINEFDMEDMTKPEDVVIFVEFSWRKKLKKLGTN